MPSELEQLGLEAAWSVAWDEAIGGVEVTPALDEFDRLTYRFTFLIDKARSRERLGLVKSLRDSLIARNDEHFGDIALLDRADWNKRALA